MKNSNDILNVLYESIYPRIESRADHAFKEFGFQKTDDGWRATRGLGSGLGDRGTFYYFHDRPFCLVNQAARDQVELWDYLQSRDGLDDLHTFKELARLAEYRVAKYDPAVFGEFHTVRKQFHLLESALDYCKGRLWGKEGEPARHYLQEFGISEKEIDGMEWGFFPPKEMMVRYLTFLGYSKKHVADSGLETQGFGDTHVIVLPYRDPVGRLKGLLGMSMLSEQQLRRVGEMRWKRTERMVMDTPFNLNAARDHETMVIVEGFFDALVATRRGIGGVIATGGGGLGETQLERAVAYGGRNFYLAFNNDREGREGWRDEKGEYHNSHTLSAVELILQNGLNAWTVPLPEHYATPGEVLCGSSLSGMPALGVEALRKALRRAKKVQSESPQDGRGWRERMSWGVRQ
jgi:hypothetical protein